MDKPAVAVAAAAAIFLFLISSSSAHSCNTARTFTGNRVYSICNTLPVLDSFLYWNYHQANHTVDIAYTHYPVNTSNWVAWALNINGSGMTGADSLVAFQGSAGMRAYTSPIADHGTTLAEGPLSFNVSSISSEFLNNNEIVIFATLQLPAGRTTFNHLWQVGPLSGDIPGIHEMNTANKISMGTVDFIKGGASKKNINIHGVLNTISWGILLPFGALVAKYLTVYKSESREWYFIHNICKISAYIIGIAGFATGLIVGQQAPIRNIIHRNIGIALFCLATFKVFVSICEPKEKKTCLIFKKHKEWYWTWYHWGNGYAVIVLTIINVFKGFDLLNVDKGWKGAYIVLVIIYGVNVVFLQLRSWCI
ncbi:cytochrome b561 and DOMON domain-containing protein At5g47530-like [Impatiens glandulifera]|uniref:cytochrome b561 and DOMON domain-containing protein At5g47530-like n=1 Tax=Impatiens glandulifera TaxID=253017 RepID=UPI001FB0B42D|nr:cytochrome b561 and DOMON domain-containing protein At5g47530-like [Impatiens glandulifera]